MRTMHFTQFVRSVSTCGVELPFAPPVGCALSPCWVCVLSRRDRVISHQINNEVKATPATPPTTPPTIAPVLDFPSLGGVGEGELVELLGEEAVEGSGGVVPPVILFAPVKGGVVPDPGAVRMIE